MASQLEAASIDDGLLCKIYDCDQELYPAPLPFSRLRAWRDASPDLSIRLRIDDTDVGAIMVMPLPQDVWAKLVSGTTKETDVEASQFVADDAKVEVGLHVFHVERFEGSKNVRGLTKMAMELVRDIVRKKPWKVVGYSALTASDAGRAVFQKLSFQVSGYQELFVRGSEGSIERICFSSKSTGSDVDAGGKEVMSQSVMMVRHGDDEF